MKLEELLLEEKLYEAWVTPFDEFSEAETEADELLEFGLNDPIDFFESNL